MNAKMKLCILPLALTSFCALADDTNKDIDENKTKAAVPVDENQPVNSPASVVQIKDKHGNIVEGNLNNGIISLANGEYAIVEYEQPDEFQIHGNWLTEFKVESFSNEGGGKNKRPVYEWVLGDGRLNFGNTGFNLGYVLKKVWFENDLNNGSDDATNFRMIEMELRPAYANSVGKHWYMFEGIYLGKTGYEKRNWDNSSYNIGGDGYGFRPYYRYQATDRFSINTDIKLLREDKDADGADGGHFDFYEAILGFSYRVTDNINAGVELFRKEGTDYNHDGDKINSVVENSIRPWMSWRIDKHNLFFKLEPNQFEITQADGRVSYESDTMKYIINYSYPITPKIYFVSEYSYKRESNKRIDGNKGFSDTEVNFGKIGLNFIF